jgi:curved DNA-binding protein CbpA
MPIKRPYETLGVPPTATDAQLRAAYRRLVQLHHPDHNQNSPDSTRRFEEVQEAYAQVLRERKHAPPPGPGGPRTSATDPHVDSRLEDLERQVREAYAARERARRAAREATAAEADRARPREHKRPTDEELGYYETDDSFTSILSDARRELSDRLKHAPEHPVAKRVSDLIQGLEELASKLDRKDR